jgi:hypothetical protein
MQGANSGAEMEVNSGTAKAGVNPNPEKGEAALAGVGEMTEASDGPGAPETIVPMVEAPSIVPASKDAVDQSPLDFLLSVMNDPQAPPRLRIKVARVTAPYVHAKAGKPKAGELAIEDPYGFTFDFDVAKTLREDILALQKSLSYGEDEKRAIEKRIFERQMTLPDAPAAYQAEDCGWEQGHLRELENILKKKRPGSKEAKKIEAEAVILTGRIKAFKARLERPLLSRLNELTDKMNGVGLTRDEAGQLHGLFGHFQHLELPQQLGDAPPDPYWAAARSYRRPSEELDKFGPRPKPKSTDGDPYWAAARAYHRAERDAGKKPKD